MPEISVCPLSSLVRTWNVGSSSARRPSATDIFSWSDFVFGSMATEITGSSNVIASSLIGLSAPRACRPVTTCLMPTAAAMSPRRSLDVLALVGVHHQDAPDALGPARSTR
jgi:hypothetical protein